MSALRVVAEMVRLIGISHLFQPPLTFFLASPRGIGLRGDLTARTALGAAILQNAAVASVALPTSLGVVVAAYATETVQGGAARTLAALLAAFWCWRLWRQLTALRVAWPRGTRLVSGLHYCLLVIFVVQGPILGVLLALARSLPRE